MRRMHTLTDLGTVVALWAHPDDETYLSGGLLASSSPPVSARSASPPPVARLPTRRPGRSERSALAAVRTEELEAALGDPRCHRAPLAGPPRRRLRRRGPRCAGRSAGPPARRRPPRHRRHLRAGRLHRAPRPPHRQRLGRPRRTCGRREPADPPRGAAGAGRRSRARRGVRRLRPGPPARLRRRGAGVPAPLSGAALDRKVEALLRQVSQTGGLVAAVGRSGSPAWVATESFAVPAAPSRADNPRR